ncbi:hypothetical protein [Erwinia sorbitola]|uniref:Uncharacterized protein n=1 Tax=Erwinia sorbitola TaxID=2681984 RepID=A0A6I6E9E8_9GAMM|nr:hypothetical protein [Erwinia sorbitola]QGU86357.1 hypothetical protein GN242_03555 [Erwinia sorbitola]
MQASDYLRIKLQSNRQLSIYTQHGFNSFAQATKNTVSDIYSGIERASWYTSCLIPRYGDVCSELITEEKRMSLSIASVFKHHDVILHMFVLYFEMLEKDSEDGNKNGSVRGLVKGIAGHSAKTAVGRSTRHAIAYALSKALSGSAIVSKVVAERIASKSPYVVFALQVFGIDQKAVLAARKLKVLEPRYFAILYTAQLEMLYYFIEPILEEVIKKVQMKTYETLDELYEQVRAKFNV